MVTSPTPSSNATRGISCCRRSAALGSAGSRRRSVAVVGAGGIGSAVIPALAGAGVGTAHDHRRRCGRARQSSPPAAVSRARRRLSQGRARAAVRRSGSTISSRRAGPGADRRGQCASLLADHDMVIDGSDNFATRLAVSDACVALGIPLLSAAAVQFQGQVGLFRSQPCYRCFVGDAFDADDCDTCAELGVLGALAATVGSFAALAGDQHDRWRRRRSGRQAPSVRRRSAELAGDQASRRPELPGLRFSLRPRRSRGHQPARHFLLAALGPVLDARRR